MLAARMLFSRSPVRVRTECHHRRAECACARRADRVSGICHESVYNSKLASMAHSCMAQYSREEAPFYIKKAKWPFATFILFSPVPLCSTLDTVNQPHGLLNVQGFICCMEM